jgi:hypothetical protein
MSASGGSHCGPNGATVIISGVMFSGSIESSVYTYFLFFSLVNSAAVEFSINAASRAIGPKSNMNLGVGTAGMTDRSRAPHPVF